MHPDMRYEQVVYQDPFLAMRIWQIDSAESPLPEEQTRYEQAWKSQQYSQWHYHKEVEFLLILEGELTAFCKQERLLLRPGDIAIFGASEPHTTIQTKDGGLSYIVFQIDLRKYWDTSTIKNMQHFSEVIRPLSALNYVYREHAEIRMQTAELIRGIVREMDERQIGYELAVSARIKSMLLLLLRGDTDRLLNYLDNQLLERLRPAFDYVEAQLGEKLSVSEISKRLNMSYTHFVKLFKKAVGMSFTEFVAVSRIKRAERLLLTGHLSIAEVVEAVGIANLGHFYQLFRRYNGCSPKQFKNRLREPLAAASDRR